MKVQMSMWALDPSRAGSVRMWPGVHVLDEGAGEHLEVDAQGAFVAGVVTWSGLARGHVIVK